MANPLHQAVKKQRARVCLGVLEPEFRQTAQSQGSNAASNFIHKRCVSDKLSKVQESLKSGPAGARSDTKRSRFLNVSLSGLCPNWVSFEAMRPICYRLLATHLSRTEYIFPHDILANM